MQSQQREDGQDTPAHYSLASFATTLKAVATRRQQSAFLTCWALEVATEESHFVFGVGGPSALCSYTNLAQGGDQIRSTRSAGGEMELSSNPA